MDIEELNSRLNDKFILTNEKVTLTQKGYDRLNIILSDLSDNNNIIVKKRWSDKFIIITSMLIISLILNLYFKNLEFESVVLFITVTTPLIVLKKILNGFSHLYDKSDKNCFLLTKNNIEIMLSPLSYNGVNDVKKSIRSKILKFNSIIILLLLIAISYLATFLLAITFVILVVTFTREFEKALKTMIEELNK